MSFNESNKGQPWLAVLVVFSLAAFFLALIWVRMPPVIGSNIADEHFSLNDWDAIGEPNALEGTIQVEHSDNFDLPAQIGNEPEVQKFGDNPKIAIIIDDFGPAGHGLLVRGFLNLPYNLTFAVIPGNDATIRIGREVNKRGRELFIHLPMEPHRPVSMGERDMVWCWMGQGEVEEIMDRALAELAGATGANNHMGSKATADTTLMEILARDFARRGLMFVDSRTGPESVALKWMRRMGVPAVGRDVFIDYYNHPLDIEKQIEELKTIARRRGWAVGIGHVRKGTLTALERTLPKMEQEGFRILSVGDLIREIMPVGPAYRKPTPEVLATAQ